MRNKPAMWLTVMVAVGLATNAWCQTFAPAPGSFKIRYVSNLNIGDSTINLSNSGTGGATDPAGTLCANTYVFDQSAVMLGCCSCRVTPDALNSYSVKNQLIPAASVEIPNTVVIKLLASKANGATPCNPATVTADNLTPGMRAWATTLHALPTSPVSYGVTETEFTPGGLVESEFTELITDCATILTTPGGTCAGCSVGGR
jgi:hypothetical protein